MKCTNANTISITLNILLFFIGINISTEMRIDNTVFAGQYLNVAAIGGSVSTDKMQSVSMQSQNTRTILQSNDTTQQGTIDDDDILGDLFYTGVLGYFSTYQSIMKVSGLNDRVFQGLLPSMGTFGFVPKVNYYFGLPQSIVAGGIEFDLDSINIFTASSDNDSIKKRNFVMQSGIVSSILEHAIPEQLFAKRGQVSY